VNIKGPPGKLYKKQLEMLNDSDEFVSAPMASQMKNIKSCILKSFPEYGNPRCILSLPDPREKFLKRAKPPLYISIL
jgi:hypothetical protein